MGLKSSLNPSQNAPKLDIIAQLTPLPSETLAGTGFPKGKKNSNETLRKRARAKFVGDEIKRRLCQVHSPLHKSYLGSCLCATALVQNGKKITSKYCNQRWCIVCSRIRTAKAITGYYEQLNSIGQLYFVTLTIPNVKVQKLKDAIKSMHTEWRQITNKAIKKTELKNEKYQGVRKLEVTYNLRRKDYHPHYHLIMNNKDVADYILKRWLQRFPQANKDAQNIRVVSVDNKKDILLELFKYSTKFHAKAIDENGKKVVVISAYHLDKIFIALRSLRTYQPFGGIRRISEEVDNLEAEEFENMMSKKVTWYWSEQDWYDIETGECLTWYEPDKHDTNLINSIRLIKSLKTTTLNSVEND